MKKKEAGLQTMVCLAARPLDAISAHADALEGVRKSEVRQGDWVVVDTRNSSYSIYALGDGRYCVSGGWFDRQGISPATVTINGCTWGGSAIKTDFVAGRGLCLEFGNRVVTTRIRNIRLIRSCDFESSN